MYHVYEKDCIRARFTGAGYGTVKRRECVRRVCYVAVAYVGDGARALISGVYQSRDDAFDRVWYASRGAAASVSYGVEKVRALLTPDGQLYCATWYRDDNE